METVFTDIYEEVLTGERKTFPKGMWNNQEAAIVIIKYLIKEKLEWSREDVCTNFNHGVLKEAKLDGMLTSCFDGSPYAALNAAYPREYKPWELHSVPKSFWNNTSCVMAIKWLIEEKLQWSHSDVCSKLNRQVFADAGLKGMFFRCFNGSPYGALELAYPGQYNPWELKSTPKSFWNQETGAIATKWLIEEKLKWTREEACFHLSAQVFAKNGLASMLHVCFSGSPFKALEAVYPGEYKPWELRGTPKNFWNEQTGMEATKWLIEEKLGWTVEQARKNVTRDLFKRYGLGGMLSISFGNTPRRAMEAAYPVK